MHINLDAIPQVAIEFMNRDHAEFAELRQKLLDLLSVDKSADSIQTLLDEFLSHTRRHFGDEEQEMMASNFPAYSVHRSEHETVLAEMENQIQQWKVSANNRALHQWIDEPVGRWFLNHIQTMDFMTAGFIHAR